MNESELRAALAEAERQRDEARANERAARKLLAEPTLNARTLSENVRLMRKLGAAEAAVADTREALEHLISTADWYRRCLEDVIDHTPVRGLAEARAAYDSSQLRARAVLDAEPEAKP